MSTLPLPVQPDPALDAHDREIIRPLAERIAEIASLPVQQTTIAEWKRHNALRPGRPMLWLDEVPWHEIDAPQLAIRCKDIHWQFYERLMRWTLYQWEHFPVDMVVEAKVEVPVEMSNTGFGVASRTVQQRAEGLHAQSIASTHFEPVIQEEADIDKIQDPVVTVDWALTEEKRQRTHDMLGDLLEVTVTGPKGLWFAPWDILVTWWGVEEALMDLVMRPDMVKAAMQRLVDASLSGLDQMVEQKALTLNNGNGRSSSGGQSWTDELPGPDYDPEWVKPHNLWGSATAQIFSEVSPQMHDEFALQFELPWLERFGLNCYGCCEPLHHKVEMLKQIPRLRRISMSPWTRAEIGCPAVGGEFIYSYKPNPAFLADDNWNPDKVRQELAHVLHHAKENGCIVEMTLKDISTIRSDPKRLTDWWQVATEMAEGF